jgi:hypothetical protein
MHDEDAHTLNLTAAAVMHHLGHCGTCRIAQRDGRELRSSDWLGRGFCRAGSQLLAHWRVAEVVYLETMLNREKA